MPCPTCDHTVQGIGYGLYHCPRCGTYIDEDGSAKVPALIARLIRFRQELTEAQRDVWHALGIDECILLPGERGWK